MESSNQDSFYVQLPAGNYDSGEKEDHGYGHSNDRADVGKNPKRHKGAALWLAQVDAQVNHFSSIL